MSDFAGDMAAITAVIHRYSLAMDTRRFGLMNDVFMPTAEIFLGDMHFADRERGVAAIRACIECCSITHHMNSNIMAEIDGNQAEVSSSFRAWHRGTDDRVGEVFEGLGTYLDKFVLSPSGWRIAKRRESCPIIFGSLDFFSAADAVVTRLRHS